MASAEARAYNGGLFK